jgi:hypothetical protein
MVYRLAHAHRTSVGHHASRHAAELLTVVRGARSWTEAIAARSIEVYAEPDLAGALAHWFVGPARRLRPLSCQARSHIGALDPVER